MKWLRDPGLAPIVEKVEAGQRLTFDEGMQLFHTRDLNTLMGIIFLCSIIVVAVNILTDLVYAWLDPRIELK